ncbi:MAG: helix-hairpin-helix domain-containing protein [Ignavibacteriales bacterium]
MIKDFLALLIFLCLISEVTFSQTDTTYEINNDIESILDNENEEENDLILDKLEFFKTNPINLNKCSVEQLLEIPFMNREDAENIIEYRNSNGTIFSKNELLNIPVLPRNISLALLPYVEIHDRNESGKINSKSDENIKHTSLLLRNRMQEDLNIRKGFSENKFIGSKYKFYNRANFNYHNYEMGVLTEKDAGEKSFYDFYSFYFSAKNIWQFNQIIIGDYFIEFGEGLALWNSYLLAKSSSVLNNLSQNRNNIFPYKSTDENKYFRGAAFSFQYNKYMVTGFISYNKIDGTTNADDTTFTLAYDGYHRTKSEIEKKDKLNIFAFGGIADINFSDQFSLKFLNMNYRFGSVNPSLALNQRMNSVYSIANKFAYHSIYFEGETALISNKIKMIQNLSLRIRKNFTAVFSYRNYPEGTKNFFGNGFGESSSRENEQGFYTGVRFFNDFGIFNIYYDMFRLGSTNNYPFSLSGNEFLFFYQKNFGKEINLSAKYFIEKKEVPLVQENTNKISSRKTERIRFEFEFNPVHSISNKVRIEFSTVKNQKSDLDDNGFLVFDDVKFRLFSNRLHAAFRLVFFRTDSYESRIYSFENDLQGIMTNPAFYDDGYKWYILLKYSVFRNIIISLKYSELVKPGADFIASGLSEISGNSERKFSLQMDLNF